MDFKGTKGDWKIDKHSRAVGPISTDDDQSYGMVLPVAYYEFCDDMDSNAKLIAAAPDLLKALQFALPWLPTADGEAIHLAEQAIKKAIG
ncbi:hypothetical protein RJE46_14240 [Cedecea neteri]|uniref:hypothetical protein n=1 Tax=Cedecea neteri TaxID=158822 RepID=UPI002893236E|nr:hypothetical protein [Cedecea neteri]WNJ77792.1 hypothetical protein RJE46_14240 [Cedecea neteri]